MKKITAVFVFVFLLLCGTRLVSADTCCYLEIIDIGQYDDSVTVDFYYENGTNTDRNVNISITYFDEDQNKTVCIAEETLTVSPGEGDVSYTIENLELIYHFKYTLKCTLEGLCDNEWCGGGADSWTFRTDTESIELIYIADSVRTNLSPIGQTKAAVQFLPSSAGYYMFTMQLKDEFDNWYTDDDSSARDYTSNQDICEDYIFLEKDVAYTYIVRNNNDEQLSTNVFIGKAPVTEIIPLTINPSDNDVCFSMSNYYGLSSIDVPVSGLYAFSKSTDFGEVSVMNEQGKSVQRIYGKKDEIFLEKGIYYIDTTRMDSEYTMDISYSALESIKFDEKIQQEEPSKYYNFKVNQPVKLTKTSSAENAAAVAFWDEGGNTLWLDYSEASTVIPNGNYVVEIIKDSSHLPMDVTFSCEPVPIIPIGTSYMSTMSLNRDGEDYYYYAFKAPEDGEYDINFSKHNNWHGFVCGVDSLYTDLFTLSMKKDEYVLLYGTAQSELAVNKSRCNSN